MRRVHIVANAGAGSADNAAAARHAAERLAARGLHVDLDVVAVPRQLPAVAARAAGSQADVVVAAGGDGTVATVASALLQSPGPKGPALLGLLPLGTFNYFAREIGTPLDLDEAIDVIAAGETSSVSVGDLNGRIFINNSSIGLYPAALRRRETTYRRIGRSQAAAYLSAALVLLKPPSLLNLQMHADGKPLTRRTPLLFIGVNPSQLAAFEMPGAECLASRRLPICITRPAAVTRLATLAARAFFRGLHGTDALEVVCARELSVTLRRTRIRVALDGEIVRLNAPLRYRLRPDALRVVTGRRG